MPRRHSLMRQPRPFRRRRVVRTRPSRRAFTLVELVVALVLLAIAALGVASTATFVARLAASGRALALATRATAHVVDSLRAVPCTSLGAGSANTAAGTVRWTTVSTPVTREVRAVLTPSSSRVRQVIREEALRPCD